jgi:hypothetical protein
MNHIPLLLVVISNEAINLLLYLNSANSIIICRNIKMTKISFYL